MKAIVSIHPTLFIAAVLATSWTLFFAPVSRASDEASVANDTVGDTQSIRGFQPLRPEAVRDSVRSIATVFAIAFTGFILIFAGLVRYYTPRAWTRPYRPTPQFPGSRPSAPASEAVRDKDRYDLEGDIADYLKGL
jgi:hypothetical protein